jgi:hypothetical protein
MYKFENYQQNRQLFCLPFGKGVDIYLDHRHPRDTWRGRSAHWKRSKRSRLDCDVRHRSREAGREDMISMTQRGGVALAAFALIAAAGSASADISSTVFSITATLDNGAGPSYTFDVDYNPSNHDGNGNFLWSLGDAVDILDDNDQSVFRLDGASIRIENSREGGFPSQLVALNFQVLAGAQNTVFSVDSAVLSFAAISNSAGRASAAVSVTDLNGDGATYTPQGAGAYGSFYNGANNFQNLIGAPVVAAALSTATTNEAFPGVGFSNIGTPLTDISSDWNFTLSAGDLASGTSEFEIIPAPASAVLGLVALTGLRRRR